MLNSKILLDFCKVFKKLQKKWKVKGLQLILILSTFAIGGSLCGFIGRKLLGFFSVDSGIVWLLLYILLITILWPLCLRGYCSKREPPNMSANIDTASSEYENSVAHPAALPAPKVEPALATADPELYAAWREHVRAGFAQNNTMFRRILDAFMEPYYTTLWMYRILFGLGVVAFVAAIIVSIWLREPLFALVFGGLSVGAFLSYFISRPLRALEENLQLITWLGVIYNSYWTSLATIQDAATVQEDLRKTPAETVAAIEKLIDKQSKLHRKRSEVADATKG